jgi:hypothetical protein
MIKIGSVMGNFKAVARWTREIIKMLYENEDVAAF